MLDEGDMGSTCTGTWNHKAGRDWWFHMERDRPGNSELVDIKQLLVGMSGVVGVVGDVPVIDRPLKLPHPNLEMLDNGRINSPLHSPS
jgi:hypothetical protein